MTELWCVRLETTGTDKSNAHKQSGRGNQLKKGCGGVEATKKEKKRKK